MICWQPHWIGVMKILIFIGTTILLSLLNQCETQMQARRSDMGAFIDSVLGAYLVSMQWISLWLQTIFIQLECPEGYLLGSGQLCYKLGQGPCDVGELWTEIGNTGIGKCKQLPSAMPVFPNIPINTIRPMVPPWWGQGGSQRERCGRCRRNGRTEICCEGYGIGPR